MEGGDNTSRLLTSFHVAIFLLFFLSLLARLTKHRERIDCSQYTNDFLGISI